LSFKTLYDCRGGIRDLLSLGFDLLEFGLGETAHRSMRPFWGA